MQLQISAYRHKIVDFPRWNDDGALIDPVNPQVNEFAVSSSATLIIYGLDNDF